MSGYSFVGSELVESGLWSWSSTTIILQAAQTFLFAPVPGDTYTNSTTLTEALTFPWIAPFDLILYRMFVRHNSLSGASNLTYTIRVGGANTALALVLSSGAQLGFNLVTEVPVLEGQPVSCGVLNPGASITTRPKVECLWRRAA